MIDYKVMTLLQALSLLFLWRCLLQCTARSVLIEECRLIFQHLYRVLSLCLTTIEHLVLFCGLDCDLGVMLIMSCVEVVKMCGRT
jgi:hypothetical protein